METHARLDDAEERKSNGVWACECCVRVRLTHYGKVGGGMDGDGD